MDAYELSVCLGFLLFVLFLNVWRAGVSYRLTHMRTTTFPAMPSFAALLLLAATAVCAGADKVTVTPWCANSMRVQVAPAGAVAKPTPGALKNRALVENCVPGAPTQLEGTEGVTNGNLVATATGADGMVFKRADTGVTLFSIVYAFGKSSTQGYVREQGAGGVVRWSPVV